VLRQCRFGHRLKDLERLAVAAVRIHYAVEVCRHRTDPV
jgi:hypothetical protein